MKKSEIESKNNKAYDRFNEFFEPIKKMANDYLEEKIKKYSYVDKYKIINYIVSWSETYFMQFKRSKRRKNKRGCLKTSLMQAMVLLEAVVIKMKEQKK